MVLLPDFRVRQRDYLLEISRAMTAQLDLSEVLRLILRSSVAMLAGEVGLIALKEDHSASMRVRALIGAGPEHVGVFEPLLSAGSADETGDLYGPDFDEKLQRIARSLGQPLRQAVSLPMYLGEETVGVIYVFRTFTGAATRDDMRVLQSFADQAAIAVNNARLYHQVDQERKRLQSILEHSADGVMILDARRVILSFNRAMSRISGWTPEKAISQPYSAVIAWAGRPQGTDLGEAMQSGWPASHKTASSPNDALYVEGDLIRPDGTLIGVGITYAPLFDAEDRLLNVIASVRDISHFREAEKMKSTFISVVSHELKTPVALIKGYAGTLRREDANWDPTVVQRSLAVIEEEADRLTELIDNLLAASKLQAESMRIKYEDMSLLKTVQASVERFRTQTDKHKFVVEFPPDFPIVPGDSARLRQVIDNLISNAVKYSPNGGQILITGAFTPDEVRVSIQDEGVGIPQSEWSRIFERFYRIEDALSRKTQGTGLGLYLSRAVIEAHGGQIGVHSAPGKGSTFYFTLPRQRAYSL